MLRIASKGEAFLGTYQRIGIEKFKQSESMSAGRGKVSE